MLIKLVLFSQHWIIQRLDNQGISWGLNVWTLSWYSNNKKNFSRFSTYGLRNHQALLHCVTEEKVFVLFCFLVCLWVIDWVAIHRTSHHSQLSNNYDERGWEESWILSLSSSFSVCPSCIHGRKPVPVHTHLSLLNGHRELPVGTVNKVVGGLTKIPSSAKP